MHANGVANEGTKLGDLGHVGNAAGADDRIAITVGVTVGAIVGDFVLEGDFVGVIDTFGVGFVVGASVGFTVGGSGGVTVGVIVYDSDDVNVGDKDGRVELNCTGDGDWLKG